MAVLCPFLRYVVSDWHNHKLRIVAPDGTVHTLAGSGGIGHSDGSGDQVSPASIAVLVVLMRELYWFFQGKS